MSEIFMMKILGDRLSWPSRVVFYNMSRYMAVFRTWKFEGQSL